MKRFLAPAFSTKALSEQEDIVQGCVDAFVARLKCIKGISAKGLNMTIWYEMLAFDILGEMAFGESFHCIEQERPHFWQQMIAKHLYLITVVDNLRRYPFIRWLGVKLLPWLTVDIQKKHSGYSREKIVRYFVRPACPCGGLDLLTENRSRLKFSGTRKDFLTDLVEKAQIGEISNEELTAHASTIV